MLGSIPASSTQKGVSIMPTLKVLHDDTYFEESLNLEEYPDLEVDYALQTVWIGSCRYEHDGDRVLIEFDEFTTWIRQYRNGKVVEEILIECHEDGGPTALSVIKDGEWRLIAEFE